MNLNENEKTHPLFLHAYEPSPLISALGALIDEVVEFSNIVKVFNLQDIMPFHHEYESAVKLVIALSHSDSSKYRSAPASIKNPYHQKSFGTNRNAVVIPKTPDTNQQTPNPGNQ